LNINFGHIIPSNSGITSEMLHRYLCDAASHTEMRLIDHAIETDDIFADAVEGLMQLPTAELATIFDNLDKKVVETRTQATQYPISQSSNLQYPNLKVVHRRPMRWIWWAAASVVALFGAAFWIFTNPTPITQNTDNQSVVEVLPAPKPAEVQSLDTLRTQLPPLSNSSISAAPNRSKTTVTTANEATIAYSDSENPQFDIADNKPNIVVVPPPPAAEIMETNAVPSPSKPVLSQEPTIAQPNLKNKDLVTAEGKIPAKMDAEAYKSTQKVYSSDKIKEPEQSKEVATYTLDAEKKVSDNPNRPAAKPSVAKRQESVKVDPTANYPGAAAQNVMLPPAQGTHTPAVSALNTAAQIFAKGEAFYNQKKYAEAVGFFEKTLETEKKGNLHQKSQWLLANSRIQLNQKAAAKILLNQIISEGSPFSESAKTLLLKIGN
jgi:hypothetical protein